MVFPRHLQRGELFQNSLGLGSASSPPRPARPRPSRQWTPEGLHRAAVRLLSVIQKRRPWRGHQLVSQESASDEDRVVPRRARRPQQPRPRRAFPPAPGSPAAPARQRSPVGQRHHRVGQLLVERQALCQQPLHVRFGSSPGAARCPRSGARPRQRRSAARRRCGGRAPRAPARRGRCRRRGRSRRRRRAPAAPPPPRPRAPGRPPPRPPRTPGGSACRAPLPSARRSRSSPARPCARRRAPCSCRPP